MFEFYTEIVLGLWQKHLVQRRKRLQLKVKCNICHLHLSRFKKLLNWHPCVCSNWRSFYVTFLPLADIFSSILLVDVDSMVLL